MMNPYDYHKYLINEYILNKPGSTKLMRNDESKWKSDKNVIFENMKFVWNEDAPPKFWEEKLAKKYYDKLFKEYCLCDLSRYKENKIANRFRISKEVLSGKGQFICAEVSCTEVTQLRTWEVNFSYTEEGTKKNALVKIRLCGDCSDKLNHHSKKREVKRLTKSKRKQTRSPKSSDIKSEPQSPQEPSSSTNSTPIPQDSHEDPTDTREEPEIVQSSNQESLWKKSDEVEHKDRNFDDYLEDLLL